ncbi:MAG TPA: glycosyltransferase family 4 protein [Mycobacteriales bacterium]|nr:glycosyltransferase family 4 protein [Mycobacteriales bacterium]
MRFALYHPWVYLTGGIERVLLELQQRSRHDWVIYTHHLDRERTFPELAKTVIELTPRVSVQRELLPLMRAATTIARTQLPADGRAGLLVSSEGLGDFVVARNHDEPVAVYCHTPLKIVHDPSTRDALRVDSPHKYAAMRLLAPAFVAADRAAWGEYDHVFANSEETRRRIVAAGLRDASDVEVLEPGVDVDRFAAASSHPRERRFLLAGRVMWQKNVELAIDAVRLLSERGIEAPLVVAGTVDDKSSTYADSLRARARGLPIEFRIDVSDDELVKLYGSSMAALFTARNEDFGLVPLEAMAAGTPILAVDAGGPRETVLDGRTGWLRPATDEAFSLEMQRILDGTIDIESMREPARQRAAEFGWQRMVDRVDDAMEQLASARG